MIRMSLSDSIWRMFEESIVETSWSVKQTYSFLYESQEEHGDRRQDSDGRGWGARIESCGKLRQVLMIKFQIRVCGKMAIYCV